MRLKLGRICPRCGNEQTYIYDSRKGKDGTYYRRRKCDCGFKWLTVEVDYYDYLNVLGANPFGVKK